MTGMYDVSNLRISKHQAQDCLKFEWIYSTVQILRKYSSEGIAKIGLCLKRCYNSIFSNLNLVSELEDLGLPEKTGSKCMKFDKWNISNIVTISWGSIFDRLRRLVWEI